MFKEYGCPYIGLKLKSYALRRVRRGPKNWESFPKYNSVKKTKSIPGPTTKKLAIKNNTIPINIGKTAIDKIKSKKRNFEVVNRPR